MSFGQCESKPLETYSHLIKRLNEYERPSTFFKVVEDGDADMVAIGRAFISHPDLVKWFELDAPINPPNPNTFCTPGPVGYIYQPFLEEQQ